MEREQAVLELRKLEGVDLRALANKYGITVWKGDKKNKGWLGHTLERYLELPLNSSQSPNFGSWELKSVPLKRQGGELVVKETMAITMIDGVNVLQKTFEESHLLSKLRKAVVCARIFESQAEEHTVLFKVATFDIGNAHVYNQVKLDYEETRECIRSHGFHCLTGSMGKLVQPRTKGAGHGSTSRAFYARTGFVAHILGLKTLPELGVP